MVTVQKAGLAEIKQLRAYLAEAEAGLAWLACGLARCPTIWLAGWLAGLLAGWLAACLSVCLSPSRERSLAYRLACWPVMSPLLELTRIHI